jgi:hypothetical protein
VKGVGRVPLFLISRGVGFSYRETIRLGAKLAQDFSDSDLDTFIVFGRKVYDRREGSTSAVHAGGAL